MLFCNINFTPELLKINSTLQWADKRLIFCRHTNEAHAKSFTHVIEKCAFDEVITLNINFPLFQQQRGNHLITLWHAYIKWQNMHAYYIFGFPHTQKDIFDCTKIGLKSHLNLIVLSLLLQVWCATPVTATTSACGCCLALCSSVSSVAPYAHCSSTRPAQEGETVEGRDGNGSIVGCTSCTYFSVCNIVCMVNFRTNGEVY